MIKPRAENAAGTATVHAGTGGKLIDFIAVERHHHCPQPLQYRTGFRPENLQNLQAVLARRQAGFKCEIVAFPQHGLLLSKSESLMREAMQAGRITSAGWT